MLSEVNLDSNRVASQDASVAIVAVAKNIASSFQSDFQRITESFGAFKYVEWFIVESDSDDQSSILLKTLKDKGENLDFISLGNLTEQFPGRTERLAYARNKYLDFINANLTRFDYMAVVDLNNLNSKLTSEAISSAFVRSDWDVVCANQSSNYYDVWALRHPIWSPNDCWEYHRFLRQYFRNPETAFATAIKSRMIKIGKEHEWIQVESAFGGLAIYRCDILGSAKYIGKTPYGEPICEHVPFNQNLVDNGFRIYINPKMINTTRTDHTLRSMFGSRISRLSKYPFKFLRKILK